jgi:hypothetical protein
LEKNGNIDYFDEKSENNENIEYFDEKSLFLYIWRPKTHGDTIFSRKFQ